MREEDKDFGCLDLGEDGWVLVIRQRGDTRGV